ncbi:MAG: guanylate kinase [Chloroflexi bacterium]|nr:guanylate kinase [Chloroflexota bacterium]MBU1746844.1 guanylate kinase [Chloroflexota bacterium]
MTAWPDLSLASGLLVVLSGPSGAGKDSVIARAVQLGCPLCFVPTVTSRPPRPDEVNGRDYHFVTTERFQAMIAASEFLEWALVYDDYKGNRRADVKAALDAGNHVVLRVDVQGARTLRQLVPEAILVFVTPPSWAALETRLRQRKTETATALAHRLRKAREEMAALPEFDYVVINQHGELDAAAQRLTAIVRAEECRVKPRRVML